MSEEEKTVSLRVVSKEKDAQAVRDAIGEAERELGVSSQAKVEEPKDRAIPGWHVTLVDIGVEFAKVFFEKYGESIADWLAGKLGLDESKGEAVTKPGEA